MLGFFLLPALLTAQEAPQRSLEAIEFFAGYGWNQLKPFKAGEPRKDYRQIPLLADFDFNLKNFTKKVGVNPPGLLQFQVEPFFSFVTSPDRNIETGTSFFIKIGILPQTSRIQPYIKAGPGMVYMTQNTAEQGTKFNFIETGAAGFHFFINKNTAFSAEYRFRHLSNAGIKEPNGGINSRFVLAGVTYQY